MTSLAAEQANSEGEEQVGSGTVSEVSDDELFSSAYRLQLAAAELRAEMTAISDQTAYSLITTRGLLKKLLAERGRDDLISELDFRGRSDNLAGVRSIPLG